MKKGCSLEGSMPERCEMVMLLERLLKSLKLTVVHEIMGRMELVSTDVWGVYYLMLEFLEDCVSTKLDFK